MRKSGSYAFDNGYRAVVRISEDEAQRLLRASDWTVAPENVFNKDWFEIQEEDCAVYLHDGQWWLVRQVNRTRR